MSREQIILSYISFRQNNNVDSLLNLLSDNCILITADQSKYSRSELKSYYSTSQACEPSVSFVQKEDYRLYVDLSFAFGFKIIRCYFDFAPNDKITCIELKNIGFF